jgi:hypothetical protein
MLTAALWLLLFVPYGLARVHHAEWNAQIAASGFGLILAVLATWALGQHMKWIGDTYRLAKGHADLTIANRNRSHLANVIATALVLPLFSTLFLLRTFSWLLEPAAVVALLSVWALLLVIAARLSVYLGVSIADWVKKQRRR